MADLDDRIRGRSKLESRKSALSMRSMCWTADSLRRANCPFPVGTDRDNYQAAFELLKEQRYEQAAMAFRQFLTSFPARVAWHRERSVLACGVLLCPPTSLRIRRLRQFRIVIERLFRVLAKVPDALLEDGLLQLRTWVGGHDAREALSTGPGSVHGHHRRAVSGTASETNDRRGSLDLELRVTLGSDGGGTRTRTWDQRLKRPMLYQLSYTPSLGNPRDNTETAMQMTSRRLQTKQATPNSTAAIITRFVRARSATCCPIDSQVRPVDVSAVENSQVRWQQPR